jgi:hypothetical protein
LQAAHEPAATPIHAQAEEAEHGSGGGKRGFSRAGGGIASEAAEDEREVVRRHGDTIFERESSGPRDVLDRTEAA